MQSDMIDTHDLKRVFVTERSLAMPLNIWSRARNQSELGREVGLGRTIPITGWACPNGCSLIAGQEGER